MCRILTTACNRVDELILKSIEVILTVGWKRFDRSFADAFDECGGRAKLENLVQNQDSQVNRNLAAVILAKEVPMGMLELVFHLRNPAEESLELWRRLSNALGALYDKDESYHAVVNCAVGHDIIRDLCGQLRLKDEISYRHDLRER